MVLILFLILFIAGCVAVATMLALDGEFGGAFAFHAVALLILLALVLVVAPDELGVSWVPKGAEEFTRRLEKGKVYRLIAAESVNYENDGEKILLVSDEGLTRHHYAIRVKVSIPIPERFTLINGQPRAVK